MASFFSSSLVSTTLSFLFLLTPVSSLQFYHYALVIQWPYSYCSTLNVECHPDSIVGDFKVHGLWPAFQNGQSVPKASCTGPSFPLVNAVRTWNIHGLLTQYWPNLNILDDDYWLWNHEWAEHGICSGLEPKAYCEKALDLFADLGIPALAYNLPQKGIWPVYSYPRNILHQAFKDIMRYNVTVKCYYKCYGAKKYYYLWELYVCVDPATSKQTDCPVHFKNCGTSNERILWPHQLF